MSKVTSKLQVTIPKAIADQLSIAPGDEVEWIAGVESVRVVPAKALKRQGASTARRLRLFDVTTNRQHERERVAPRIDAGAGRGWTARGALRAWPLSGPYAECFGIEILYSEDFQHDRLYGSVRVINPFVDP